MLAILRTFLVIHPVLFFSTMIMGSISMLISPFDKDGSKQIRLARIWARMLCLSMGIRVRVEGLEKLDFSRNYIFADNHLSTPIRLHCWEICQSTYGFLQKVRFSQSPSWVAICVLQATSR